MNSNKNTTVRGKSGRATITRTFTLYPDQDTKLILAEKNRKVTERQTSISQILQELIEAGLDVTTGRAKQYLDARDQAIDFEEDVAGLLASSYEVQRNAKVETADGARTHRADFVITGPRGKCIIELKSSSKRDRLELALGQSLILKQEFSLPVCVCVPVVLDSQLADVFRIAKVALVEAGDLMKWVRGEVG